jgi:hypothetical protein
MGIQQGNAACLCTMDIQLGMQHEKAAWKSSMYIQYGDIGMDHGHEALHTALACRVALQNGQA